MIVAYYCSFRSDSNSDAKFWEASRFVIFDHQRSWWHQKTTHYFYFHHGRHLEGILQLKKMADCSLAAGWLSWHQIGRRFYEHAVLLLHGLPMIITVSQGCLKICHVSTMTLKRVFLLIVYCYTILRFLVWFWSGPLTFWQLPIAQQKFLEKNNSDCKKTKHKCHKWKGIGRQKHFGWPQRMSEI